MDRYRTAIMYSAYAVFSMTDFYGWALMCGDCLIGHAHDYEGAQKLVEKLQPHLIPKIHLVPLTKEKMLKWKLR